MDSRAGLPTAKLVTDVDGAGSSERRGCPGGFEGAAVLVDGAAFADSVDLSVVLLDSRAAAVLVDSDREAGDRRGRRGLVGRSEREAALSWWIRGRRCPGGLSGLRGLG